MNDDAGARLRWRGLPRWAGVLAAAASIALLTSGCGGGGTSAGPGASPGMNTNKGQEQALAYSQCMRSHGVPNFPDPSGNGLSVNSNALGVSNTVLQAAMNACRKLQPGGGPAALSSPKILAEALKYAQCLRTHGEPNFPDPSSDGVFNISASSGINPNSSAFQAAEQACRSVQPSNTGMRWENPS